MKTFTTINGCKRNLEKNFKYTLQEISTEYMFDSYACDTTNYDYLFDQFSNAVIENNQDVVPQIYYYDKEVATEWLKEYTRFLKEEQ